MFVRLCEKLDIHFLQINGENTFIFIEIPDGFLNDDTVLQASFQKYFSSRDTWDFEAFATNDYIDFFRSGTEIGHQDADFGGRLLPAMRSIRCLKPDSLFFFVVINTSHAKRMFVDTFDWWTVKTNKRICSEVENSALRVKSKKIQSRWHTYKGVQFLQMAEMPRRSKTHESHSTCAPQQIVSKIQ